MVVQVTPAQVRLDLILRRELALLDVREEYAFALAHPLFAASLPLSRLELEAYVRLPRPAAPIVVYDDGEGLAGLAAERLRGMGFKNVAELSGGLAAWRGAGFELFQDVNSYCKAFGELVEARRHTPSLPPEELKARLDRGEDMVVLDARRFEEYRTMSIPTGVSTPGAELVLRARAMAPDPATTVVVNCAGRTRSLIGAQSLINAGLPNPVAALRNGTIGWTLAGQALEYGQERSAPEPSLELRQEAVERARAVAYRAGVRRLDWCELPGVADDPSRSCYRFDVRQPQAYEAAHLPGFRNAPGGQLVQETDAFAPIRGARIILYDDLGPRADMTASWLAQMGWDVFVLDGTPPSVLIASGPEAADTPAPPSVREVEPRALGGGSGEGRLIVDFGSGPAYRAGHVPGAAFAIRSRVHEAATSLRAAHEVVLVSPDDRLARFAAPEVKAITGRPPLVLAGGTAAWAAAGLPLQSGEGRALTPFEDVYRRPYEGADNPREAMQAYLDWEFGLVAQLERDGTHGFVAI